MTNGIFSETEEFRRWPAWPKGGLRSFGIEQTIGMIDILVRNTKSYALCFPKRY
jgi:hypothetical protein